MRWYDGGMEALMPLPKSTRGIGSGINEPTYLDFYRSCAEGYASVEEDYAFRRYPDAYYHTYDVLEFFWKALNVLMNGNYVKTHLPAERHFDSLMNRFGSYMDGKTASKLKQIFERYNPSWTTSNPDGRAWSRYGDGSRTPYDIVREPMSRIAVEDSKEVAGTLARVNRKIRIESGTLQVGILDGRFSPSNPTEKICNISPWGDFSDNPVADWVNALSLISGVNLTKVAVLELSPRFQIVVNPFGEAYPDLPASRNILPGYTQIRNFISNGGVFVTAGGHPFTYYYDITTGTQTDIFKVVRNVIRAMPSLGFVQNQPVVSIPTTNVIPDNLLSIDFDSETTWDTGRGGGTPMTLYRRPQAGKFGSFTLSEQLNEFRAIDSQRSPKAIPVVHGRRSDNIEVYPAALIPRGLGLLYHLGLDLSRGKTREFEFARSAVEALCQNFGSYFDSHPGTIPNGRSTQVSNQV